MIPILDPLRSVIRPEWRERIYVGIGATSVVLGSLGYEGNTAAAISQIALAAVGLIFALLHTTSELRAALYAVVLALQAACGLWSIGNDATWAAVVAVAASVLGMSVAAAKAPVPYDVPASRVRRFTDTDYDRAADERIKDWDEER